MLTRLKVNGFKNLINVDVRFGAFTCIAGVNGVGKSNLFDAIRFLSALADRPLLEAVSAIRDSGKRASDIRSLFHHIGPFAAKTMSFEAEMIVPPSAVDDLGQRAEASITMLRYKLVLEYRVAPDVLIGGRLEIQHEELNHINLSDASRSLLFPHNPEWRKSVVKGKRNSAFISTESSSNNQTLIKLHKDGTSGRARTFIAADLPRTVLSATTAAESPTALVARREMQSWQLLQLEPTQLRKEDEFSDLTPTRLSSTGAHLPATLYALARQHTLQTDDGNPNQHPSPEQIYGQVARRLAELLDDVDTLNIERDERRELLTLYLTGRDQTTHSARALSDGTLRFLALAVIEINPATGGVICLEEPENGIHPARMPAMLRLLEAIATDVQLPVSADNPLRQVIINTHEPAVVQLIPDDSLLFASLEEQQTTADSYVPLKPDTLPQMPEYLRFQSVTFRYLPKTWRTKSTDAPRLIPKGDLLAYLNPIAPELNRKHDTQTILPRHRVIDRPDLQPLLPFFNHDNDTA